MTLSNPAQYISGRTVQEQMNSLIDYVDTRAAEVATDAIASDVAQVHSDAADAHTDALAAAASAAAAAGTLANAVKKTGEASQSIAGDIAVAGALSGGSISSSGNVDGATIGSGATPVTCGDLTAYGSVSLDDTTLQGNLGVADPSALINLSGAGSVLVPAPTSNSEAATKKYVDDSLAGYAPMVRTTGNQNVAGIKTIPEIRQRTYYSTKHFNMPADLSGGNYICVYKAVADSGTDRNAFIMWHNTRKGLSSQVKECGFISIGGRLTAVQIANIAGTVPSNHFAMTRKDISATSAEYSFWATGQIKSFDIMFESIGTNNLSCYEVEGTTQTSDFSTYDEVVYL